MEIPQIEPNMYLIIVQETIATKYNFNVCHLKGQSENVNNVNQD